MSSEEDWGGSGGLVSLSKRTPVCIHNKNLQHVCTMREKVTLIPLSKHLC